ncbi:hypothetical protein [Thalassotalea sp. PLHSN55]|uniref:hypothetical protein n=1 Tax=Thalassotalea sp. PLHSN55 TaxID=3435888 RepID=UPI003F86FE83
MKKLTAEQALAQKIAQLPDEINPDRDLWLGIERAIEQQSHAPVVDEKKGPLAVVWATAASFAAVMLIGYLVNLSPTTGVSSGELVALMQQNFEQQKVTLLVSLGQPKINELPSAMQEQLKQLKSARLAIKQALANDENNVDLINLLDWTQKQELELIEKLYTPQWQHI